MLPSTSPRPWPSPQGPHPHAHRLTPPARLPHLLLAFRSQDNRDPSLALARHLGPGYYDVGWRAVEAAPRAADFAHGTGHDLLLLVRGGGLRAAPAHHADCVLHASRASTNARAAVPITHLPWPTLAGANVLLSGGCGRKSPRSNVWAVSLLLSVEVQAVKRCNATPCGRWLDAPERPARPLVASRQPLRRTTETTTTAAATSCRHRARAWCWTLRRPRTPRCPAAAAGRCRWLWRAAVPASPGAPSRRPKCNRGVFGVPAHVSRHKLFV